MFLRKKLSTTCLLLAFCSVCTLSLHAQETTLSPLHVEGPFLVDANGVKHNLHGFAQTFSPYFNEKGTQWNDYNVNGCLNYNKGIIDKIMNAGWKMTFVRQHMDPYWSNTPGVSTTGENDISAFDFNRFKTYLDQVFIPMAEYAISKGLYVVMRPPGVCPEKIYVDGEYQDYLLKVWKHVAQQPKLKNNGAVMFELANEPIGIYYKDGTRAGDQEMTEYFQEIVDTIRHYCDNILLIPGLGYQSNYAGFAKYPIKGENIGYAVHCYPGWYNGGHGDDEVVVNYREFKRGWDAQIMPVAVDHPVVVTEMDWAPSKYAPLSWGKSVTGEAGKTGFGANFKRIADETCNVSWLLFTGGDQLAKYDDNAADGQTFLTDPEACPRPCYRWYQYYASQEYADLINQPDYRPELKEEPLFSLTEEFFNPNIWEQGTFDEATGCLKTGKYGFGGWQYPQGVDLSKSKYLVVELHQAQSCGTSFRLFDNNNYWSAPYRSNFDNNQTKMVIDLQKMVAYKDDQCTQFDHNVDPSHIYIVGFWTYGGSPVYIKSVYLSDDGETPSTILQVSDEQCVKEEYYSLNGQRLQRPNKGLNIVKQVLSNGKTIYFKKCYK
ncbi:MAG: cellulase family glycosylhydrolase [Prevotella sp.]|nr:cellulase family glycosylhydrolase [Prevotella sp.]